jgi:hypothetical protein
MKILSGVVWIAAVVCFAMAAALAGGELARLTIPPPVAHDHVVVVGVGAR